MCTIKNMGSRRHEARGKQDLVGGASDDEWEEDTGEERKRGMWLNG